MKNYSKQREEIIEILKNSYNHPTAEEVYMKAKAKDPAVSRSTVYRNLNMLTENGIITKIPMPFGADRFDYKKELHNHIICTKCGKVFDFKYDFDFKNLNYIVQNQTDVEILSNSFILEGICKNCKKI